MLKLLIGALELLISKFYRNRSYPRFYVLETVARVPYFAYLSVLHLYETLGIWRKADLLKIHFAESWNELHHLLIMESLGGNKYWIDRFIARHVAMIYFWITVILYFASPSTAYRFSELVERHAYETYDSFLNSHGPELKGLPAPNIAVQYYRDGDLYMFDEFQTTHLPTDRRPLIDSLYDVFVAIREDEMEHVKTMVACQHPEEKVALSSPHSQILETV